MTEAPGTSVVPDKEAPNCHVESVDTDSPAERAGFKPGDIITSFDNKPIEREAFYWEHEGNRAVRLDNWKLVAKGPAGKWELYDMEKDRTEMNDLAGEQPWAADVSPAGDRVAYLSDRSPAARAVVLADLRTGRRVTTREHRGLWAPRGRRVPR